MVKHNPDKGQQLVKKDPQSKRYNLNIPSNPLYDTLQLARSVLFDHPVFNLSALSEFYGLDNSGSHRAEKDTENCFKNIFFNIQ